MRTVTGRRMGYSDRATAHGSLQWAVALMLVCLLSVSCSGPGETPAAGGGQEPEQPRPGNEGQASPAGGWVADGVISDGEYDQMMDEGGFRYYWNLERDVIQIGMEADAEAWIAIGIQPGRAMKDADIIIGVVTPEGVTISDQFSTGTFGPHMPDTELGGTSDILEVGGTRADGITVIEWSRLLETGDDYDNPLTPGESNGIIWAYGPGDNMSIAHARVGYGEIVP